MSLSKKKQKSVIRAWKWRFLGIAIIRLGDLEGLEKGLKEAKNAAEIRLRVIARLQSRLWAALERR